MLIEVGIASARAGDARSMVDDDGLGKDVADIRFLQAGSKIYKNHSNPEDYSS
jgi:hypothetical protein